MASDFNQHLGQELSQGLRLSPQQLQLVRLLEMTAPELDEEVARQLDDNPALERAECPEPASEGDFNETAEQLQRADYRDDDAPPMPRSGRPDSDFDIQSTLRSAAPTLQEYLEEQLSRSEVPAAAQPLAKFIIGNIDPTGYLSTSLRSMEASLEAAGIHVSHEQMLEAFRAVRELDPAGVGAVDLRDCLLLQLRRGEPKPEAEADWRAATEIVQDFFDLLGKKHYPQLMRETGLDAEALRRAIAVVRSLNPKPGLQVGDEEAERRATTIVPDFQVEIDGDRAHVALLSAPPALQVEESFEREAARPAATPRERQAQAFIKMKRDEAANFISVLRRRSDTLMAVMRAIVDMQWPFFLSGDPADLRPMVLRDIAEHTGLDISVISRAAQGKYVETPAGVFPLKMFLNERQAEDSDATSHTLLQAVKDVIDGEDPAHPLSDQAICDALAQRGIDMARRTVTKYRERLGLPPARLRKSL